MQELQPPSEDEPAIEKTGSKMSRVIQIARKALKTKATAASRPNLRITMSSDGQRVVTIPSASSPTITDVTDVDMTDASMTTEGATTGTAPDRRGELPLLSGFNHSGRHYQFYHGMGLRVWRDS